MAHASDYLENKLIDHIFRAATFAKPTALWVALYTAAPTDAGGGTEVSGGGYARVSQPPGDASWKSTQNTTSGVSTGTGGQTSNATPITFPVPSANWGTVTHFAIFDAATAGTLLLWGPLAAPRPIVLNDPAPLFKSGDLTVTVL